MRHNVDAMAEIEIRATNDDGDWRAEVVVREGGSETRHSVTVSAETLTRLAPGDVDPARLLRASFEFMLEREPKESILRAFELPLIGRYFPEYEGEIRRRLSG